MLRAKKAAAAQGAKSNDLLFEIYDYLRIGPAGRRPLRLKLRPNTRSVIGMRRLQRPKR
jgi:hypothetical protein